MFFLDIYAAWSNLYIYIYIEVYTWIGYNNDVWGYNNDVWVWRVLFHKVKIQVQEFSKWNLN